MVRRLLTRLVVLSVLAGLSVGANGEAKPEPAEASPAAAEQAKPAQSQTRHQVEIAGNRIRYTATAGWLILADDQDKPIARFGYTAYTLDGVKDRSRRPVMFAFNGGPGSSSIWLHMGILGPRRVVVSDNNYAPPPPSERVSNAYSVLDVTDIVMIDPVGTGFSKPLGEAKTSDFWGVDQDLK
jgi:carboxypeptidase C (cathepsin A)